MISSNVYLVKYAKFVGVRNERTVGLKKSTYKEISFWSSFDISVVKRGLSYFYSEFLEMYFVG